jgi:hypothetical protein
MMNYGAYDREEDQYDRDLRDGLITPEQHKAYIRDLRRAYHEELEDEAREAYDRVMDRG